MVCIWNGVSSIQRGSPFFKNKNVGWVIGEQQNIIKKG